MGFISKLFSGGASTLVDSVGKTLDNLITTKGEKMTLDNEMKKAEQQFELEMQKLSLQEQSLILDEKKAYLADTDSARQMGIAVQTSANAGWLAKNIAPVLAIVTTFLTILLFYIIVFDGDTVTDDNREIIFYILGALSAIVTQIFGYYFGSSTGSKSKEDALHRAAQQASMNQASSNK